MPIEEGRGYQGMTLITAAFSSTSIGGGGCHFLRKIVLKINLTSGPQ